MTTVLDGDLLALIRDCEMSSEKTYAIHCDWLAAICEELLLRRRLAEQTMGVRVDGDDR